MKTKNLISVAFVLLLGLSLQAQNVKQATWSAALGGTIGNVYNSQLNVPLVQIGSSLTALEPTTGAVLWKTQFASSLSKIEPIDGTPFSLVVESMSTETLLLNLSDGKTINISKLIKGKIDSYYVIPESYDLVFYSKNPDFFTVIDLTAFAIRWNQKADFSNKPESTTAKLSKFGLLPSRRKTAEGLVAGYKY